MAPDQVLAQKRELVWNACSHIETEYIPNLSFCGNAILDFAGMTFQEADSDDEKLEKVLRSLPSATRLDVGWLGFSGSPRTHEALGRRTETFLAPDGVTLQHLQKPTMKADEYPLLIEDYEKFMKGTLLARKYPQLFEDKQGAIDSLKVVVEEAASRPMSNFNKVLANVCEDLGFLLWPGGLPRFSHPADYVFDRLRGFAGTLTDLRRNPKLFKDAIEMLFRTRSNHFDNLELSNVYASYMPHIAPYMNKGQYKEFFFPYFKEMITNISNAGNKTYMSLENNWMPVIDSFLDIPKDSVVVMVDDDDIFELNKIIGHHQVLTGGALLQNLKLQTKDKVIDYAKRVIDEVAPGGGFMFTTNKMWVCKGDINQNMLDVFNFAHEYGRK
ncbi:MAG: hypothetical protein FWG10_11325 [Eubacteriaceae bacterium]|nr:hypothetical protein [Eubacteriaceae bacterium]